ncbi:MAG: hypothetical protein SFV54_16680 [Bryobacteraceae bacterium]|nr:hypothetical protein [Bryobacteraceae bacterium]
MMNNTGEGDRSSNQRGFLVVEFGAVSAATAVLIGLLLPAVQTARVANNEAQARAGLAAAAQEAAEWYRVRGEFPSSTGFQVVDKTTGAPAKTTVAFGYRMSWHAAADKMTISVEPFVPGKTGSLTIARTITGNGALITETTIPSSIPQRNAELMAQSLLVHAAETLKSLQPPSTNWFVILPQLEQAELQQRAPGVLGNFIGTDGTKMLRASAFVGVNSANLRDESLKALPASFWEGIARIMELGAGGEDLTQAAIGQLPGIHQWQATPFSYTALKSVLGLTGISFTDWIPAWSTDGTSNTVFYAEKAWRADSERNAGTEQSQLAMMGETLALRMATFRGQTLKMIMDAQSAGYSQPAADAKLVW